MSNKIIPYSIEAEESLLGNIITYPEALRETIEAGIVADDFYLQKHQTIFNILSSMYEAREKVDLVSLSTKLKDFSVYDSLGGIEYLMQLSATTISAKYTSEYINIVRNKSLARRVIKVGEEIADDAYNSTVSINELLENVEKKVIDVTRVSNMDSNVHDSEEIFSSAVEKIIKIQEQGSDVTGVKSLYSDLDHRTAGFQNGDLILLAARPSMGKTAFALNLALNSAAVTQGSVLIFSVEMPHYQVANRMLAAKAKVDISKIRVGNLNNEEWSRINEASQILRSQKIYIDDTPGVKVSEMLAKARKLKHDDNLYMIIIDYIQLIQSAGKYGSREQDVSEISRQLKAMARELDVPVIALSQLSRRAEQRENRRPMLSDLRESGALEQDADLVLFLYRDAYYNRDEENPEDIENVELIIAKHRNGPTDTIELAFERKINAFYGVKKKEID